VTVVRLALSRRVAVLGALGGYLPSDSAPDTIRSLNALWDAFTTASGLFLGVFAIAVSLLAFEARVLATWIKWLGVGAGVCLIIGAGSLATPFRGVGPFWVLGQLATFIWIASTSVWVATEKEPGRLNYRFRLVIRSMGRFARDPDKP
jgi:hypothetical protein